jgi:anti-anti-sigma factor
MADEFDVNVKKKDGVWLFTTHGYINNLGGETIAREYNKITQDDTKVYLFDLADSPIVNSIGVSVLIELLEDTIEKKHILAFCNCASIVKKTFQIMGITQYAKIYDTIEMALADLTTK